MNHPEMKVGIVGCGNISRAHVGAYKNIAGARVAQVFDVHRPAAEAMAEKLNAELPEWNVTVADSLEAMAASGLDAVSVCTPPGTHLESCSPFLKAGVPVLSEKPFEVGIERAQQLAEAVQASDAMYMIAFCHRFSPHVREAKRLIDEESELVGKPVFFRNLFGGKIDITTGHRSNPELSGGGVLIDNGAHSLDLFRFLVDDVRSIQARTMNQLQESRVEDFASIDIEGVNGTAAQISGSYSFPAVYNSIEIFCSKATLTINYALPWRPELAIFIPGEGERAVPVEPVYERFTAEVEYFLNCVRSGTSPTPGVQDALANSILVDAAYRSAREGRRIAIS